MLTELTVFWESVSFVNHADYEKANRNSLKNYEKAVNDMKRKRRQYASSYSHIEYSAKRYRCTQNSARISKPHRPKSPPKFPAKILL